MSIQPNEPWVGSQPWSVTVTPPQPPVPPVHGKKPKKLRIRTILLGSHKRS
jgi:hypothetical protein